MLYLCRFRFRHTGVDAADTSIFAMRNPVASSKVIQVVRTVLTVGFDGISAVAEVGHGLCRFSGANPTGGTSPSRIKIRSLMPTSQVTDASIKEGAALTLAASFEGYYHELAIPAAAGSVLSHVLDYADPFRLEKGEGLAIRTTLASVVGTTVSGSIWWAETDN
jgi:hypothetical protein